MHNYPFPPAPPPPGYHYELNEHGWELKRPFSVWWYPLLIFLLPGAGLTIALLLACFKEPNPTGRLIAQILVVIVIALWAAIFFMAWQQGWFAR